MCLCAYCVCMHVIFYEEHVKRVLFSEKHTLASLEPLAVTYGYSLPTGGSQP